MQTPWHPGRQQQFAETSGDDWQERQQHLQELLALCFDAGFVAGPLADAQVG